MDLTSDRAQWLYATCVGEGVSYKCLGKTHSFDAQKLEEHKEAITAAVSQIANVEVHVTFVQMCYLKDGTQWGDHAQMLSLVAVGVASGALVELYNEGGTNLVVALPSSAWAQ